MDSQIEEIKNKLNVVDVVGSYVKLSKTGVNYRGICPFHSEKGPSFFVSPSRQMFKCFGCGAGGSIFDFIMRIEGVEFGDALKVLANKAGVALKRENPQLRTQRQRLHEICDLACSFFEKQLHNSVWGSKAKEYLLKRGITEESIKKWRIGYSPDTWQSLSDFVVGKGYSREEIVKAGLAVQSDKGNNPYDRFRGRIIFPIFDLNGQAVGFGARVFKDANIKETAKYINTPQTLIYDKSNILYGINNAKLAIRKNNQCVLTEGYTDAIMCHQAGFENTVSVSGTALTPRHLSFLKRYSDNLILAFDMDLAGDNATKRGINLAESQGFNIKIIDSYYNAKDPADIILENPKNWQDALEKARTIMDFYFDSAFKKFDKNIPQGKKDIGKIILPAIKRLQNKIEQSYWVQKLSEKLGVKEEAVLEELKSVKVEQMYFPKSDEGQRVQINDNQSLTQEGRIKLLEDKIVALVLKDPDNLNLIEESHHNFFTERTRNFIENIKKIMVHPEFTKSVDSKDFKAAFGSLSENNNIQYGVDFKDFLNTLSLRAEVDFQEDGPEELLLCIAQLENMHARDGLGKMAGLIEEEQDDQKKSELIKDFNNKARELHKQKK